MLKFLQGFIGSRQSGAPDARSRRDPAPIDVYAGDATFHLAQGLVLHNGLPILQEKALWDWLGKAVPETDRRAAWEKCERGWLLHFRDALGPAFRLDEADTAAVVSSLPPNISKATLEFMQRTLRRVLTILEGIGQAQPWGKDLLIVFDDTDRYYQYVSYYYPEKGEFAFSGGMYLDRP